MRQLTLAQLLKPASKIELYYYCIEMLICFGVNMQRTHALILLARKSQFFIQFCLYKFA